MTDKAGKLPGLENFLHLSICDILSKVFESLTVLRDWIDKDIVTTQTISIISVVHMAMIIIK